MLAKYIVHVKRAEKPRTAPLLTNSYGVMGMLVAISSSSVSVLLCSILSDSCAHARVIYLSRCDVHDQLIASSHKYESET